MVSNSTITISLDESLKLKIDEICGLLREMIVKLDTVNSKLDEHRESD